MQSSSPKPGLISTIITGVIIVAHMWSLLLVSPVITFIIKLVHCVDDKMKLLSLREMSQTDLRILATSALILNDDSDFVIELIKWARALKMNIRSLVNLSLDYYLMSKNPKKFRHFVSLLEKHKVPSGEAVKEALTFTGQWIERPFEIFIDESSISRLNDIRFLSQLWAKYVKKSPQNSQLHNYLMGIGIHDFRKLLIEFQNNFCHMAEFASNDDLRTLLNLYTEEIILPLSYLTDVLIKLFNNKKQSKNATVIVEYMLERGMTTHFLFSNSKLRNEFFSKPSSKLNQKICKLNSQVETSTLNKIENLYVESIRRGGDINFFKSMFSNPIVDPSEKLQRIFLYDIIIHNLIAGFSKNSKTNVCRDQKIIKSLLDQIFNLDLDGHVSHNILISLLIHTLQNCTEDSQKLVLDFMMDKKLSLSHVLHLLIHKASFGNVNENIVNQILDLVAQDFCSKIFINRTLLSILISRSRFFKCFMNHHLVNGKRRRRLCPVISRTIFSFISLTSRSERDGEFFQTVKKYFFEKDLGTPDQMLRLAFMELKKSPIEKSAYYTHPSHLLPWQLLDLIAIPDLEKSNYLSQTTMIEIVRQLFEYVPKGNFKIVCDFFSGFASRLAVLGYADSVVELITALGVYRGSLTVESGIKIQKIMSKKVFKSAIDGGKMSTLVTILEKSKDYDVDDQFLFPEINDLILKLPKAIDQLAPICRGRKILNEKAWRLLVTQSSLALNELIELCPHGMQVDSIVSINLVFSIFRE